MAEVRPILLEAACADETTGAPWMDVRRTPPELKLPRLLQEASATSSTPPSAPVAVHVFIAWPPEG